MATKHPKGPTVRQFWKRFPDDDTCLEHLMRTRYGERHVCAKCGKSAHYYRVSTRTCYVCEYCGHQVYPMAGTPFEKSRTPLQSWFFVMFLFTASRHGVSAMEVHRQIGVTYKTAWRMCFEIRKYMGYVDGDTPLGGRGRGIVEVDKAFIGGYDRKGKDDKSIVLGMAERGGEVITRVLPDKKVPTITGHIAANVKRESRVMTDTAWAFDPLGVNGYTHERVNHSAGEYVRGDCHTNTLEGFWSLVQRSIKGTHVWVSAKHLQTYLREFEFRWNMRKDPHLMLDLLLQAFPSPKAAA